jgi:hypothetical protein
MRWLRANIRWGVACAHFALAVQLVVSFGHLHIDAIAGLPQATPSLVQAAGDVRDFDIGSKHQPHQPSDDCCPICVLIYLAGSMLPGSAPSPIPPVVVAVAPPVIGSEHAPAVLLSRSFQARAPPIG